MYLFDYMHCSHFFFEEKKLNRIHIMRFCLMIEGGNMENENSLEIVLKCLFF